MHVSRFNVAVALIGVASLGGCEGCKPLDQSLRQVVEFQYDHVANAEQIHFGKPPSGLSVAGSFVSPTDGGFWAIFNLCSLDVQGKELASFKYDVANFFVEYGKSEFGPLQPFAVRYGASTSLNSAADTPKVIDAIANETQLGPSTQVFPHGFYPSLRYRVAVLIPGSLERYGGEQLTLRYHGQPSIVLGRGQRPAHIPFAGPDASISSDCRPLAHEG
jgi:hypothetical protein